jgi:hypothetical protein
VGLGGRGSCTTRGCDQFLAMHGSFGWYVEGPIPEEAQERLVGGFTYVGQ